MNRNIIRPVALGVAAGVGTVFTIIAWDVLDPPYEVARWVDRSRMTRAQREEVDGLEAARRAETAESVRKYREYVEQTRAMFRPELLGVAEVSRLEQLSTVELLAEIDHAQTRKRAVWDQPWSPTDSESATRTVGVWDAQLRAMRSEFDSRRWGDRRRGTNWVDRLRLDNAYSWVYDHTREIQTTQPSHAAAPSTESTETADLAGEVPGLASEDT
ncbi:hypothetical protein [Nocardia sp. NPDC005366]|uniref:hypothetical protein n=1 Tax=Nocardia sp. NPDC005366 TaxID=3156878 RepID=UPI0033A8B5F8